MHYSSKEENKLNPLAFTGLKPNHNKRGGNVPAWNAQNEHEQYSTQVLTQGSSWMLTLKMFTFTHPIAQHLGKSISWAEDNGDKKKYCPSLGLSGTVSLAKLGQQTHSHLLNHLKSHLFKLSYWLCVCVRVHSQKFALTVFCSLLCNGLCAPIWRTST